MATTPESTKNKIRESLGLIPELPVALVYYESETQYEFLAMLPQLAESYYRLIIVPATPIAEKQLHTVISGFLQQSGSIIGGWNLEGAADTIIAFRYSPAISGKNAQIVDPLGRWLSQELAS